MLLQKCACEFVYLYWLWQQSASFQFSHFFAGLFGRGFVKQTTMVEAKKFIYAKVFVGSPRLDNFKLESETLPALSDGGKFVANCVSD